MVSATNEFVFNLASIFSKRCAMFLTSRNCSEKYVFRMLLPRSVTGIVGLSNMWRYDLEPNFRASDCFLYFFPFIDDLLEFATG
ncbi:uncharacterized protein Dvar_23050 [Desulfosarcina variabilis str. Montpellier]